MSRVYTGKGDDGSTGLLFGGRVPKDHLLPEAYGTVDEANSAIGVVLSHPSVPAEMRQCLEEIQHDLFDLGGELCIPGHSAIDASFIERLEQKLDEFNAALPVFRHPAAVAEPGAAVVAGARVDLAESVSHKRYCQRYLNSR